MIIFLNEFINPTIRAMYIETYPPNIGGGGARGTKGEREYPIVTRVGWAVTIGCKTIYNTT